MDATGPRTEAELLQWTPASNRPGTFPRDLLVPGERVLFETRPTLYGLYWGRLAVMAVLDLLWIAVAVGLPTNPTGGLFTGITTLFMVYYVLKWRSSAYALTDRRVVSVVGIRHPDLTEALLDQVSNLKLEPGSSGGIKFDATPPGAPAKLLGGRKFAKTVYWRALPLASRTYEFVQQAFALRLVQVSEQSLRADLVARISERTLPCEYCGTLVDPDALGPVNPRCPSCGAPFVPVEVQRAATQARLTASPAPVASTAFPPYGPARPAAAAGPKQAGAARPTDPSPRPPAPTAAGGSSAAPGTPGEREPAHRRRDRRGVAPAIAVGWSIALAALLSVAGAAIVSDGGPATLPAASVAPTLSTSGVSPPPTVGAAAVFDAADGYVLMFGGVDPAGNPVGWTWSFLHNNWTNLSSIVGLAPAPRWGEGLAYDPSDGYVVLFGGCLNVGCTAVSNATWVYAHDRWTNVTSSGPTEPPGRGRTMMTYDAHDGYVLLFGGNGAGGALLNDEWGFTAGRWAAVGNLSSVRPSPRAGAVMAYDPTTTTTLLFGGLSTSASLGDTWSYQNGSWTNLSSGAGSAPGPRRLAMMAYDGTDGYLLLLNGYNTSFLGDEWTYSAGGWAPLSPHGRPTASFGAVLVYDPVDRYVVYFSGDTAQGVLTSTLVYANGTWTLLINPTYSFLTPLGLVLVIVAVTALPLAGAVVVGTRVRRRQERELAVDFVLPPGETPQWFPTGSGFASRYLPQLLVFVVMVPLLVFVLTAGSGAGGLVVLAALLPVFALLGVLLTWVTWSQAVRSVGLVRSGVILSRRAGELRIPWSRLQPGVMPPRRGWYWFQYVLPGRSGMLRGFSVPVAQARAILVSPLAPPWVLTGAVATGLGLPARAQGASTGATLAPPAWFPAPPPGTPTATGPASPAPGLPLASSSPGPPVLAPSYPPVTYPPPSPSSPPPTPSPAYGTRPAVPSRPPPGMVPCPRCGQLNPSARVAFCTACGARLR